MGDDEKGPMMFRKPPEEQKSGLDRWAGARIVRGGEQLARQTTRQAELLFKNAMTGAIKDAMKRDPGMAEKMSESQMAELIRGIGTETTVIEIRQPGMGTKTAQV